MQYIYIAILWLVAVFLLYRVTNFKKMNTTQPIYFSVHVNACIVFAILCYSIALLVTSKKMALLVYGLFNIAFYGFAYTFLHYARVYARYEKFPGIIRLIYGILALYFIGAFIVNIKTERIFSVILSEDAFGNTYYMIGHMSATMVLYNIMFYAALGGSVAIFLIRGFTIAKIYRKKYTNLAILVIFAGFTDIFSDFLGVCFDFSLLIYAFVSLLIYYYSFEFVPRGLLKQLITYIMKYNDKGYIFYDMFGRCQYRNKKAEEFYQVAGGGAKRESALKKWLNGKNMQDIEETSWERIMEIDGVVRTYIITFRQLYDDKSNYLGSFFILEDVTEERAAYYDEWYQATHDELTGIYNREYFLEQAYKAVCEHPKEEYCILCSDVHDFKLINDLFGVEKGNEVLLACANVIRGAAKKGDVYGRIGSDRFAVCMPSSHFSDEKLERCRVALASLTVNENLADKFYFGIYENVGTDIPISVVCDRTIMAINKIKGNMQQHLVYYDEQYRKQVRYEQQMITDFNNSLRERNFHLYLLPYVNVDGEVNGAEALVRWFHPIKGLMMPQDFVPIFENTGIISRLDLYVWELACKQLRRWKQLGFEDLFISINISAKDFFYINVYETLTNMVEQHDINPNNLHLEITEIAVVQDFDNMLGILKKFREYGFRIYMDDFGNGYSSLNVLKDLPLDVIKIDMGFIQKSTKSEKSKKILNMIVSLSNKLGIDVIAEGVETSYQMEYINEIGCHTYQGYQFSKPISIQNFENRYFVKAYE